MQVSKHFIIYLLWILPSIVVAQLTTYPLESRKQTKEPSTPAARTKTEHEQLSLPFWDDFSATTDYPSELLWYKSRQVLVNSEQAVNPPSLNVATFDGLTENGTPYTENPNDILDFGYRDTLESQAIKMTEVDLSLRNTVFLSFYYQWGGNGEPPDPNDFLRIEFRGVDGWESVVTLFATEENADPTVFYDTLIRINAARFYHDDFQFRFISFGRKSGRYDAWHIDYVYLNKGRNENDRSIPDRTLTNKLGPIFGKYFSIPKKTLLKNTESNSTIITAPTFEAYNMRVGDPTTADYLTHGEFKNYNDGVIATYQTQLGPTSAFIGGNSEMPPLTRVLSTLPYLPDQNNTSHFDYDSDSIQVKIKVTMSAGDVYITGSNVFSTEYLEGGYSPIDFRANDTTSQVYFVDDYYAYDDGTAEYAAGLTQAGNQLAYFFDFKNTEKDTINGVLIHYPFVAGEAPTSMNFFVFANKAGMPGDTLYQELIPVIRKSNNAFIEVTFLEGIEVTGSFFLGYQEPATGRVRIGLDKSHDTGERMFYKISSTSKWIQNDRVVGNLMIRPRFGKTDVVTGLPEVEKHTSVYPNPSNGTFYILGTPPTVQVYSITGQPAEVDVNNLGDRLLINVQNAHPGIYFVRYQHGVKQVVEKILIR